MDANTLTIRPADVADGGALARLAALDSSSPPTGDSLIAEVGDEIWAAVDVRSGATIADPFRPSADVVDLLRYSAARLRGAEAGGRRNLARLLPRVA